MRNPMNSWEKSDSEYGYAIDFDEKTETKVYVVGKNDLELMQKLIRAGSEHRKFLRQIFVSVDITAPLYWWKEFDTYKVGTVSNSCSTMHKLADTPITIDCFEMDDFENVKTSNEFTDTVSTSWSAIIIILEDLRRTHSELISQMKHLNSIKDFDEAKKAETMAKKYWKELIRLLPESWLQKRTVTMNYENLLAMCSKGQRRFHKLTEWSKSFIDWARSLPYAENLIFIDEVKDV